MGNGFMGNPQKEWALYKDGYIYNLADKHEHDLRTNKDLIAACEKIGLDKASSKFAELHVIEVPDGVEFYISDYDGMEEIHENHRTWG